MFAPNLYKMPATVATRPLRSGQSMSRTAVWLIVKDQLIPRASLGDSGQNDINEYRYLTFSRLPLSIGRAQGSSCNLHCIQRRNLIKSTERRNIEARFLKHSGAGTCQQRHQSHMDEFGCLFSDHMHAE